MTTAIQKQAEARKMVSDEETTRIVYLAEDIERVILGRLDFLGLSGEEVGAIAARVRTELRTEIDMAIHHQRSTGYRGVPAI